MTANAQHLASEGEWYTPQPFIDLAHEVMGGIDLDPASSRAANERIGAEWIYTTTDNGLTQQWDCGSRLFINPPGHCGYQRIRGAVAREYKRTHRKAKLTRAPGGGYTITRICNNPTRCSCDLPRRFWCRAQSEEAARPIEWFWVGFSVNQLRKFQTYTSGGPLQTGSVCIPRKRHPYVYPDGTKSKQPSHDSFLFYSGENWKRFIWHAMKIGEVVGQPFGDLVRSIAAEASP